jgi:hypothetical protein
MSNDQEVIINSKAPVRLKGWPKGWDVNIATLLPAIGNEGWELAAISSRNSSIAVDGQAMLVTEEVWVFKRPKT